MEVSTMVQEKESSTQPTPEPPSENESELSLQEKIINALFLSATFGYAVYTILNIDHGITRGWTTSEIAMRIPLDNWGAYEDYLANKPVVTKTLINVIIYLLGDWLSQTVFQKKNVLDFDISRTMKNGFIGLCFGPLVHEYYQFSDTILPPENGLVTKLEKILMDQTIYLTVKCSIYISAVGLLNGDGLQTVQQTVKDKIGGVVITAWKFWPIIHCITYGLIPARHRILWVNSVDLVWNAILSSQANKAEPEEGSEEQPEQLMVLHSAAAEEEHVPGLLVESTSSFKASDDDSHHTHDTVTLDNHQWVADQQHHDATIDILPTNTFSSSGNNTSTAEAVATP
jgi:protein Mpv17